MQQDPKTFIEAVRKEGASDAFVAELLKKSGWSEKQVADAFIKIYEEKTGIKIPGSPLTGAESAKDAFLHILSFGTLGVWIGALASMAFTLVEKYFPDNLAQSYGYAGSYNVSTEIASIIVAFPIFLFVMWLINKDINANPERAWSSVRRWLTYFALLVASGTLIGDLITFLAYFLRGELTERFVLKVVAVFILASGIFYYYLSTVRGRKIENNK